MFLLTFLNMLAKLPKAKAQAARSEPQWVSRGRGCLSYWKEHSDGEARHCFWMPAEPIEVDT